MVSLKSGADSDGSKQPLTHHVRLYIKYSLGMVCFAILVKFHFF